MTTTASVLEAPQSSAVRPESSRVEAFSDAVFAIALTLLVLNLQASAPRGHLGHELVAQWPAYVAYLAAFLSIAAIWVSHHDLFTRVRSVDTRVVAVNLLVLLAASLLPWPAAVIAAAGRSGDHHDQVIAAVVYAGVSFLLPWAYIALYQYLAHRPDLLTGPEAVEYCRAGARRALLSVALYPAVVAAALFVPVAALIIFALLPAFILVMLLRPAVTGPTTRTTVPHPTSPADLAQREGPAGR